METTDGTVLSTRNYAPVYAWLGRLGDAASGDLPTLVYRRVRAVATPPLDRLRMGCSYSCFTGRPWFNLRKMMCEQNVFPYALETRHFIVRHGVLLWPRFNTSAFTDLQDWDTVYVLSREPRPRWVARFSFEESQVTLTETE